MKNKILLICLIFCIILITLSCSKDSNIKSENGVKQINMLKTNIPYSIKENISLAIKKNTLEKQYGKAHLVGRSETKNYEVRTMSDESKLIVMYDNVTNAVLDIWQIKKLFTHNDFKTIEEGKSLSTEILKIDPYTNLIEKDLNTAISEHKLVNKEALVIAYVKKNDSWVVKQLTYVNPDPSDFINSINEKDLISIGLLPNTSLEDKDQ